ncbi:MAG: major capsid protein [Acidaminococcaceae bacterium]
MPVNINDPVFLIQALERKAQPASFFKDTFFPKEVTFFTKEVLIDYRKGGRKLAPVVTGATSGVVVDREGFTTSKYAPPLMLPKRVLTADDINQRAFGEQLHTNKSPAQRQMDYIGQDLSDLREMNARRTEWYAAQCMINGKVTVKGYADDGKTYIEDTITYDFDQKETLTGTATWDKATATIYKDMVSAYETVCSNSEIAPDIAVMSSNVEQLLLSNDLFLKQLDTRSLNIANFTPKVIKPGVRYVGTLPGLNIDLYVYTGAYKDDDNTMKKYLPDDYFIMGASGQGSQLFGAITQIEEGATVFSTYEGKDVPKIWTDTDSDVRMMRLGRRCMVNPACVNDWYTLKVK